MGRQGFLVFVLMGVSLILAWINYRIWYDSSGFIIRNVLGVRRDYTYSDITGLREYPKEARLYFGKRHITLDTTDAPQKMFLERVKLHYAAIHDGQSVPYVPPRIDPFHGHIINPEELGDLLRRHFRLCHRHMRLCLHRVSPGIERCAGLPRRCV